MFVAVQGVTSPAPLQSRQLLPVELDAAARFDTAGRLWMVSTDAVGVWDKDLAHADEKKLTDPRLLHQTAFSPDGARFARVLDGHAVVQRNDDLSVIARVPVGAAPTFQWPRFDDSGARLVWGGDAVVVVDVGGVRRVPLLVHEGRERAVVGAGADGGFVVPMSSETTLHFDQGRQKHITFDGVASRVYVYRGFAPAPLVSIPTVYSTNVEFTSTVTQAYVRDGDTAWRWSIDKGTRKAAIFAWSALDQRVPRRLKTSPRFDQVAELLSADGVRRGLLPWHHLSCVSPRSLWTRWDDELIKLSRRTLNLLARAKLTPGSIWKSTVCTDDVVAVIDDEQRLWSWGARSCSSAARSSTSTTSSPSAPTIPASSADHR